VLTGAGQFGQGAKALQETIKRAHKSGYLGLELKAKLALGEIQYPANKFSAGDATLAEVKKRAQEMGYGLIGTHDWELPPFPRSVALQNGGAIRKKSAQSKDKNMVEKGSLASTSFLIRG
jgi:hypothetical protein